MQYLLPDRLVQVKTPLNLTSRTRSNCGGYVRGLKAKLAKSPIHTKGIR